MSMINYNSLSLNIPSHSGLYWPQEDTDLFIEVLKNWIPKFKNDYLSKSSLRILDMGTGPGTLCLFFAKNIVDDGNFKKNTQLIGIDINPKAVENAKFNAEQNKLDNITTFIQGSLLSPIKEINNISHFDVILFNAPYLPDNLEIIDDNNSKPIDHTWKGGKLGDEITIDFLNQLSQFQNPKKTFHLFLTSSSQVNQENLLKKFKELHLDIEKLHKTHIFFEDILVYHLKYMKE